MSQSQTTKSKTLWGNACWYMFHSMAVKLKDEYSNEIQNILKHIIMICGNLPCPECSNHASKILKKLNKKNIRTQDNLIEVLWDFHNKVNIRLKKPVFSRESHDKLYAKANLPMIYRNFHEIMLQKSGNERAMIYTLARKNALQEFDNYMKNNHYKFNTI